MVRNRQDGYPYLNLSLFFFSFLNILKPQFFGKIYWLMNSGRHRAGIAKDVLKFIFLFKTLQKMATKLRQFTKRGPFSTFQLFKLSQLRYHFCKVLKRKYLKKNIPSYPPPFPVRNSLTNQFYQKN